MSLLSILNHVKQTVASPFESKSQVQATGVNALDSSSTTGSSGTTSSTDDATISANDFLTLLVTEIQNQDPTTQTDPMEYITQLVGVNSLEQLVQINQTLTGATGTTSSTTSSDAASSSAVATRPSAATSSAAAVQHAQSLAKTASSPAAGHLLPLGSNAQIPTAAETAVAHAFTHASALPTQGLPPSQVPLSPEVMRALEHSIPGATFSGQSPLPTATTAGTGSTVR